MKTTGLGGVMWKMIWVTVAVLMAMGAHGSQVDHIVQEARLKAAEGDLEAATALYHKAMQQDGENTEIRHELAKVLVEANIREPHTDSLEVIDIIEEGRKAVVD
jgi:thioredoxin-like negative regulator of GroEL